MGRFKIFSIYPKTEQEAWLYLDMLMLFSFSRHMEQLAHRTLTTNSACKVAGQRRLALR